MRLPTSLRPRFWSTLALACAAASWTQAVPSASEGAGKAPEPLPFPSAIIGRIGGKLGTVTNVKDRTPELRVDGKTEPLPANPKLRLVRVPHYAPGSLKLTVKKGKAEETEHTITLADGSKATGPIWSLASDYSLTVNARNTYDDCYLVLIVLDPKFIDGSAHYPSWEFIFQDIGGLTAGKDKTVSLDLGPVRKEAQGMGVVPVVYCAGEEIRSNLSRFTAALFRKAEVAEHADVVKQWVKDHPKTDQPLRPFVLLQPAFPPGVNVKKLPKTIDASFEVTADGTVTGASFQEKLPPKAAEAIRRALDDWLFMPRLKEGQPIATRVAVPINISNAQ